MLIKAKKSLGQCFLVNTHISKIMASKINTNNSLVIEIGPGSGSITKEILENKCTHHLIAIEKDPSLVQLLKNRKLGSKITIIQEDAVYVKIDNIIKNNGFGRYLTKNQYDISNILLNLKKKLFPHIGDKEQKEIVLISNLPYNVGSIILINCIKLNIFTKIVIILQEEVINRLIAKPKTKDYSSISVLSQARYDIKKILKISPNSFNPAPKVNSAVAVLTLKKSSVSHNTFKSLELITKTGFSKRRKKFLSNISELENKKITTIVKKYIQDFQRIEEIEVKDLLIIAEEISKC